MQKRSFPHGKNKVYSLNSSDLQTTKQQLNLYLEEKGENLGGLQKGKIIIGRNLQELLYISNN